jgi:4'-phosphopantetheinyl transferase
VEEARAPWHWERQSAGGSLAPGEVHLWRIEVDRDLDEATVIGPPLDAQEQERARRFHFDRDRNRFVTCHLAMREILAAALGCEPVEIEYAYGPFGKPALAVSRELEFNLSHTTGLALIALARGEGPLGVDVEIVRRDDPPLDVADRFFSPAELRELGATSPADKVEAFFRCWTRKEAFIKALGLGLQRDLQSFDVSLAPGDEARLVATRPDPDEAVLWTLANVDVGHRHVAALVTRGLIERLRCWQY